MNDLMNLIYTCAHLKLLDKQYEWPILLEAWSRRLASQSTPDRFLIQCMLSLTLADVGQAEEFWQPCF